jgi:hypothetical protein
MSMLACIPFCGAGRLFAESPSLSALNPAISCRRAAAAFAFTSAEASGFPAIAAAAIVWV